MGFVGFLGEILTSEQIENHLRASLPKEATIDFFSYCPTIVHESIKDELDTTSIENTYKQANLGSVYFKWFSYSPFPFIEKALSLGLPIQNKITLMYPYRLLSMYSNFSKTLEMIQEHITNTNVEYDVIIITRHDYIRHIGKYVDIFEDRPLKKGIYCKRNPHAILSSDCYTEDRVLYGEPSSMLQLVSIYEDVPSIFQDETMVYGEGILKTFLLKHFMPSELFYQQGIQFLMPCPVNLEYKRSNACKTNVAELYEMYIKSKQTH